MSYSIKYSPEKNGQYPVKINKRSWYTNMYLWIFVAAVLIGAVRLDKTGRIMELLLPGNPESTEQAAQTMLESVRQGESVSDALAVFCKEIIDDAFETS